MEHNHLAEKIINLKDKDLKLRNELIENGELSNGYHPKMEALHNENSTQLNLIIEKIGYPTTKKVGKEASEAAWLIVQHSISQPKFMKICAELLEKEVEKNQEDPKKLAYLTDRIAVFENKPQLYGTQFDWDECGEMSPNRYDDLLKVNRRRKAIGLNSLEEQTVIIRNRIRSENQHPPKDLEKRKLSYDKWRKSVGWI